MLILWSISLLCPKENVSSLQGLGRISKVYFTKSQKFRQKKKRKEKKVFNRCFYIVHRKTQDKRIYLCVAGSMICSYFNGIALQKKNSPKAKNSYRILIYSSRCHYGLEKETSKGIKWYLQPKSWFSKNTFRSEKRHFNVNT